MTVPWYKTAVPLAVLCSFPAFSQTPANNAVLPDAPRAVVQAAAPTVEVPGAAQVSGTITDEQSYAVASATVTLSASGILGDRTTTSDAGGRFSFTGVAPGQYRLIVNATGLAAYSSEVFAVAAGQAVTARPIVLHVTATTSINVVASTEQIALAQVHEEEQQRVFGVFPNFYTSYIWAAAPMTSGQKYRLATRALIDPVQFLTVAGTAGAEQIGSVYAGYGPGIEGYAKRYGATMATATTSRMLGSAVFPGLFHQDPRYFYQGSGTKRSRALHAIASTFVARGDNGKNQPSFAHLFGSLSASAIANVYLPSANRGAGVVFQTFGIDVLGNIGQNLFREFVLRGLVPSVPSFANGKHRPPGPTHQ